MRLNGCSRGKRQHARVLQVALRPAPVARRVVDDVRRHLLPAALELGHLAHLVTGAAHERGLDEIVAEYLPAERRPPGQPRQHAVRARTGAAG